MQKAIGAKSIDELEKILNFYNVCWERYQTVEELVKKDKDICSESQFLGQGTKSFLENSQHEPTRCALNIPVDNERIFVCILSYI